MRTAVDFHSHLILGSWEFLSHVYSDQKENFVCPIFSSQKPYQLRFIHFIYSSIRLRLSQLAFVPSNHGSVRS